MAKIKFGMMMTDARGKLGGQVFSKNRSGAYVRTKVTPKNDQTPRQSFIRSLLGAISQKWSTLSASARAGFNAAVGDWATTDIFGDARNPSGKTLFTKLNMNAQNAGFAEIEQVPTKIEMPVTGLSKVEIKKTPGTIVITAETDFAGGACVVNATPRLSQGTSYVKGKFRQIATELTDVPELAVLYNNYVAKFGVPNVGDNIYFEVIQVLPSGQASVPQSIKAIITA